MLLKRCARSKPRKPAACLALNVNPNPPQREANGLLQVEQSQSRAALPSSGRARRSVDLDALELQHALHSEYVIAIADDDARMHPHSIHDLDRCAQALRRRGTFRLDQNGFGRHTTASQITAAYFSFRENRIAPGPRLWSIYKERDVAGREQGRD